MIRRLTFLTLALVAAASPGYGFKRTAVGEPVKDFTLPRPGQEPFPLRQSLGSKATLVLFWAAWSPRSGEALADFQALYAAHGPEALRVVAVNVEHQEWDPAQEAPLLAFARERGVTFPVVFDQDLAVFNAYGVVAVPSTLLVDAAGTIVDALEGYAHMTRGEFRERVEEALGVRPPPAVAKPEVVGYVPKGLAERYYRMGRALLERGMAARAEGPLRKAVAEDPEYAAAQEALAEALEAEGKGDEARAVRAKLAGSGPAEAPPKAASAPPEENPAVARYLRMGRLLLEKGMVPAAVGAFEQALAADPDNAEIQQELVAARSRAALSESPQGEADASASKEAKP